MSVGLEKEDDQDEKTDDVNQEQSGDKQKGGWMG